MLNEMSDEESSFVILGSTPTPSMEQYNGHEHSMTNGNGLSISANMMQSSTQTIKNYSLLNSSFKSPSLSATNGGNIQNDSLVNSVGANKDYQPTQPLLEASTASGIDFAEQFLLGEIPADSLKYSIWKNFPSLCTPSSKVEDIGKLESLINEHIKLKDNLHKTNEAMHQHFSTINKWQKRVKELMETQATKIAQCNEINANLQEQLRLKVVENENLQLALTERDEFNQKLKLDIIRIKEEHEEKTMQFNLNLAYAAGENNDLVQEMSAKNAIIQNMTNMIEKLERQTASFELVSIVQREEQQQQSHRQNENSSTTPSQHYNEFATQLNAAREQNIQLLEDVSNKISTIKRLESESSKLQHQLLSLEMIVNENGQKSNEDIETVRQLKEELNQMSIENMEMKETVHTDYSQQIEQLKESLAREKEQHQKAIDEIQSLRSLCATRNRGFNELTVTIAEQQAELTDVKKANVILRSKEINADVQAHQKDQEVAEMKDENDFLKAQLDVYKSDFEMERQARQDIANEREELLSDLKLLQRRNQQLIDEAQSRTRLANTASSSTASAPTQSPHTPEPNRQPGGKFMCPVCNNSLPSLMALQNHVHECLEK